MIAAALGSGWHGFTGVLDDEEEITRPGIAPPPECLKIKLRYKGKPFVTIPFEESNGEDNPKRCVDSGHLIPTEESNRGPEAFGLAGRGLFDQVEGRLVLEVYLGAKDSRPG